MLWRIAVALHLGTCVELCLLESSADMLSTLLRHVYLMTVVSLMLLLLSCTYLAHHEPESVRIIIV
jgi:sensor histidine kinase regulating citrate/malate metabolism